MKFTILTLFPQWFEGFFREGVLGRAAERGLVSLETVNFRDYATDKHQSVDDAPYGGGGGMLLRPEPICAALDAVAGPPGTEGRAHVVYTSPRGATFDQNMAEKWAGLRRPLVIICGRYEGLDERVIESRVDEEVSVGDFVLSGGEIAALTMVDAVSRLVPGVLGNEASAPNDSFSSGLLEAPHYTRPEVFEDRKVPAELLSGNHGLIEKWRLEQALEVTRVRRPDLYEKWAAEHPEYFVPKKSKKRRKKRAPQDGE